MQGQGPLNLSMVRSQTRVRASLSWRTLDVAVLELDYKSGITKGRWYRSHWPSGRGAALKQSRRGT